MELDVADLVVSVPPPAVTDDSEIEFDRIASAPPDPEPISLEEIELLGPRAPVLSRLLLAPPLPTAPLELSGLALAAPPATQWATIDWPRASRIGLAVGAGLLLVGLAALGLTRKPRPSSEPAAVMVAESLPATSEPVRPSNPDALELAPPSEGSTMEARPDGEAKAEPPGARSVPASERQTARPARAGRAAVVAPDTRAVSASPPKAARPTHTAREPDPGPPPPKAPPPPASPWSSGAAANASADFNPGVAMQALRQAADRALSCRPAGGAVGSTRVAVTFAPNGHVAQATLEGPLFVGSPIGACIVGYFQKVRIVPFEGSSTTVRRTI